VTNQALQKTHYHNVVAYFCCQLVAGLSPWTPGFEPRPAHVIFVMILGQIFLRVFQFLYTVSIISPSFYINSLWLITHEITHTLTVLRSISVSHNAGWGAYTHDYIAQIRTHTYIHIHTNINIFNFDQSFEYIGRGYKAHHKNKCEWSQSTTTQ
jgi:hypothetical protein